MKIVLWFIIRDVQKTKRINVDTRSVFSDLVIPEGARYREAGFHADQPFLYRVLVEQNMKPGDTICIRRKDGTVFMEGPNEDSRIVYPWDILEGSSAGFLAVKE